VDGSLGSFDDRASFPWRDIYDRALCEYVTLIWHWAQVPTEVMIEELDLFMREILPLLEVPNYGPAAN